MINKSNNEVGFGSLQINQGHRISAHDALMAWLSTESKEWVICTQELYFSKKGLTKISREYGAYWMESENQTARSRRACVTAPEGFNGYMVTQYSTVDNVIVRFDIHGLSIISAYFASDSDIDVYFRSIHKECESKKKVVCCIDSNAYHGLWGSDLTKNTKWAGKVRGEELGVLMDEKDLHVCNEPPHPLTFIGDSKNDTSHIDVTFCTRSIYNNIHGWRVSDETFGSDHCSIVCKIEVLESTHQTVVRPNICPWKKPKLAMGQVMEQVLEKKIKKFGRIRNCEQVDITMTEHCKKIVQVLKKLYKVGKEGRKSKVYWWTKEVAEAHTELKTARRRMRKYKYADLSRYSMKRDGSLGK